MANAALSLTSLDVDALKADFIAFLQTQDRFRDYNFDGSNINVLLSVLAYNTFKNGFYLNMVASESFIDSAQMLSSMFSHAKELNYLPRSVRSSVANVNVSFTASGDSQPYIFQRGQTFSTLIKNTSYSFSVASNTAV